MKLYGVFGAGSYGRETIPILFENIMNDSNGTCEIVFVDDNLAGEVINGFKVVSTCEFIMSSVKDKYFNVAIANNRIRKRVAEELVQIGVKPITIRHSNTVVYKDTAIHDSAIISPFVTISVNSTIGKFFHANLYSYVAHDCKIGDYVTFAPGAKCNGNVIIEDNVYIGSGAIIKQGSPDSPLIIGSGAIIGMGAVVTKNIKAGLTVCGNPAKELIK